MARNPTRGVARTRTAAQKEASLTASQIIALALGSCTAIGIVVPGLTRILLFLLVAAVCTNYVMWYGISTAVSRPLAQFRYYAGL